MRARKPKRRLDSFDSLCREAGILPGDPTPAVSSPRPAEDEGWTESYSVNVKGSVTMPALTTALEVFCLRRGRKFKVGGSSVTFERYEPWKEPSEIPWSRALVTCRFCEDTHLLLSAWQAACFGFLGDPVDGCRWKRKDLRFGRWANRRLFDRKKFPPEEPAAAA